MTSPDRLLDAADFGSILFTSDLLKVDDRAQNPHSNPQRINIDWIFTLFSDIFRETLGIGECRRDYGDEGAYESPRWRVYSHLGLPFTSTSWAEVYEGATDPEFLYEIIAPRLADCLVVGFELPPYIMNVLQSAGFPFIDFAIHPVRYMTDYLFGVRTNVARWRTKLERCAVPDSVFRAFARRSKARTTRVMRGSLPDEGTALFLGQIDVDASLIADKRIAGSEDVERALVELSFVYPKVYYKQHPHNPNKQEIDQLISRVRSCERLEINVYDAFGIDRFALITTLSSGAAIEARYFGVNSSWILKRPNFFDPSHQVASEYYFPIYSDIFRTEFWQYVFSPNDVAYSPSMPDPCADTMRFTLNMKWGR